MNLKIFRLRNRLKQQEVAQFLGVSLQLIALYERNKLRPTEETHSNNQLAAVLERK